REEPSERAPFGAEAVVDEEHDARPLELSRRRYQKPHPRRKRALFEGGSLGRIGLGHSLPILSSSGSRAGARCAETRRSPCTLRLQRHCRGEGAPSLLNEALEETPTLLEINLVEELAPLQDVDPLEQ